MIQHPDQDNVFLKMYYFEDLDSQSGSKHKHVDACLQSMKMWHSSLIRDACFENLLVELSLVDLGQ